MARRALGAIFHLSIGAAALFSSGCQGCLNLDEYTVVPTGGSAGSGGTGGTGGAPGCGAPGLLHVTSVQPAAAGKVGEPGDPCAVEVDIEAGLEVRALDPDLQSCVARARILAAPGATLDSPPRIQFSENAVAGVAVTFQGGSLTLPASCASGEAVVIEEAAGAESSLLIARLQRQEATYCTQWARRAWTEDPAAAKGLRAHAIRDNDVGEVAVVGSLGGAARFEDGGAIKDVTGGAFFARYLEGGALAEVTTLAGGGAADAAMDVLPSGAKWLLTGTVQKEQPACQGCTGAVNVSEPAAVACSGTGGAGGAGTGGMTGSGGAGTGGMTGTGGAGGAGTGGAGGSGGVGGSGTGGVAGGGAGGAGTGGMAGTGGAGTGGAGGAGGTGGSGPVFDGQNAFLWPLTELSECDLFTTFGSDRLDGDLQVGFGVSTAPSSAGCSLVWAGLAGRDAWPLQSGSPGTALFDAGGASMDGFVAFSEGSDAMCSGSPGPRWNVRVTPLAGGASAVAERAAAERCTGFGGVSASAFVRSPGGGNVSLYRCQTDAGCDSAASLVPLASGADEQLVVLGLRSDGALSWSAAFGPVLAGEDAAAGSFTARSHSDLAMDSQDRLYAVFTTSGPLALQNVETFGGCEGLVENLAEGTYMVSLRQYAGDAAMCEWFHRIGP